MKYISLAEVVEEYKNTLPMYDLNKEDEDWMKMLQRGGRRLRCGSKKDIFCLFLWKGMKLVELGFSDKSPHAAMIRLLENYAKNHPKSRITKEIKNKLLC